MYGGWLGIHQIDLVHSLMVVTISESGQCQILQVILLHRPLESGVQQVGTAEEFEDTNLIVSVAYLFWEKRSSVKEGWNFVVNLLVEGRILIHQIKDHLLKVSEFCDQKTCLQLVETNWYLILEMGRFASGCVGCVCVCVKG